tara:strand:- start:2 stop:199 length:198 start_codon:yes stop_codon:yes gene_type:complete
MPKIYESPDKGKTVYAREIGAPFESRVLQPDETGKKPYTNGKKPQEASEIESSRKVSKTWSMEQD